MKLIATPNDQPDCDICRACGDHAEFITDEESGECLSNCCGEPPYSTDIDLDVER